MMRNGQVSIIGLNTSSGHSTHFQVGGDTPKVKGKEFF
jgi:hypothetical protein